MNPTRLRSWIRRYGNAGFLLVGGYLVWRHLWTNRRASLIGSMVATGVLVWLWSGHSHPALQQQPSTRRPSSAVAPHSHLPAPPLRNIRAVLLKRSGSAGADEGIYYKRWIGAVAGKQIFWQDTCFSGIASDVATQKTVYYVNDSHRGNSVIARRYDGLILWRAEDLWGPTGISDICAGGDALLVEDIGPTWGVQISHPECWEGEDGVIGSCMVTAVNSHNGATQWKASEADVGRPRWTNGTEFLDVRLDVCARAIRRVTRFGACLPVWLELRRLSDHHRLWRQRLRGCPPGLTSVRRIGGRRVKFVFANKDDYGMNEFDFVPHTDETAVVVPLGHSPIESGGLQPREPALITAGLKP